MLLPDVSAFAGLSLVKILAQMQGRCDLEKELITFLGSEIAQGATDETNHPAGQLLGLVFQRQFIGSYQSVNLGEG